MYLILVESSPFSQAPVVYHVRPLNPGAHLYEVTCRIEHPDPDGQVLRLPAWIPGSYMIREFARHIGRVDARAAGRRVRLEKTDKHSWKAARCPTPPPKTSPARP